MTIADCAANAARIILEVMNQGSGKDGRSDDWLHKSPMFHLSKANSHLTTHINHLHDPRNKDEEQHLELALTRIAMRLAQIKHAKKE